MDALRVPTRLRRPGRLLRAWVRHPRVAMAVRAAIAAALAWYVGRLVPGELGNYAYYAPMGAVVATSFTLAGSVRESVQAVASIALGAAIALAVDVVVRLDSLGVAAVVAVGVLVAGWRVLGEMGGWVVTGALFTLIFGQHDPSAFVGAYAGLTAVGAAIGMAVTWVLPSLPLAPAQEALRRVRATLAEQLTSLAEGLDQDTPPDAEEWAARRRSLDPLLATMRTAVAETREAARGNRRVNRYQDDLTLTIRQARTLDEVAFLVEDLVRLLTWQERAENERVALGPELRPAASATLRALSTALASVEDASAEQEAYAAADASLEKLVSQIQWHWSKAPEDAYLGASSIATTIRRCLESIRPQA
ncbi:hypothetical protein [Georgenia faecalis]|uniref:FUSC family protein n=1 Tax=Georgenia faecalis TaxID=2483799 RepID=A0ABV9D4M5_9MICO|nr:hypothetical protein [Georgenia faecalis]